MQIIYASKEIGDGNIGKQNDHKEKLVYVTTSPLFQNKSIKTRSTKREASIGILKNIEK